MNFAFLFHSGLASSLLGLQHWWTARRVPQPWVPPVTHPVSTIAPPKVATRCAIPTRGEPHAFALRRPLRVVRVLEVGQSRATVGRMLISGRMADVCAELDRLAASEAAVS